MLAYTYISPGKFELIDKPKHIIVCEKSPERARFVREHYPSVEVVASEDCIATVRQKCERGGTDVVLEVAVWSTFSRPPQNFALSSLQCPQMPQYFIL